MIETKGNQKEIEFVRIFNKEGKIMFSTNKKEMNQYVDKNTEACYVCHAVEKPLERLSTSERSRIFETTDHRVLAMPIRKNRGFSGFWISGCLWLMLIMIIVPIEKSSYILP
jgi:hypothetical protein